MATTAVFLPGESRGQRSLVGYSPRGHKESERAGQRRTAQCWRRSATSRLCSGVVKITETRENKGRKGS